MSSEHPTDPITDSSDDYAIEVSGLSKCYQIYDKPSDRLKQMLMRGRKQYYKEFWALKDVSFKIKKGETVGIIGRNGSGKSTLLQMICGTLNPTAGEVKVNGRVAALLELGAGFNPEFTGRENVYVNAAVLGLSREEIDARFDAIAEFADIGEFIDQPVKTYSSGMYVRLAFAVVAHVDSEILVVDEALAVGDAFFVQKCMRFLRDFVLRGTLIFVSHDVGAVLSLCESAIWLQEGQLRAVGSPKELTNVYMQALYEERQDIVSAIVEAHEVALYSATTPTQDVDSAVSHDSGIANTTKLPRDMRTDLFNGSSLRNDIQLLAFQSDGAGFGTGQARIVGVRFGDAKDRLLSWIVGGESVTLTVDVYCEAMLQGPIVGFTIKDRLGQVLFGDNTFLITQDSPLVVCAGRRVRARFAFDMPRLPNGDYTVSVAIAEGSLAEHRQHHWMHDALTFKVHTSSVYTGLVGIPMSDIQLTEFE
jgi:lipopolysaccharide transport system ATP-binding protein